MEILKTVIAAFFSLVVLFLLTKIMGQRQMSQLSAFDYINGITIGSIAAEMATNQDKVINCLVAMVIYGLVTFSISLINEHSMKLRRILSGRCLVIYHNQKIIMKNLKKSKLDINEFLTQCRIAGYFDLSKLHSVFIEPNGNLSFLPVSSEAVLTPCDMKLPKTQEDPFINIIIDGSVLDHNLKATGHNREWLNKQLKNNNIKSEKQVPLAVYSRQRGAVFFMDDTNVSSKDMFN